MARRAHATIPIPEPSAGRLEEVVRELDALRELAGGWNGYEAPPPSPDAIASARRTLDLLHRLDALPERVIPSVEGGVALVFSTHPLYTAIELFNDGEVLASLSDLAHRHEVWEISGAAFEKAGLRETLELFNLSL